AFKRVIIRRVGPLSWLLGLMSNKIAKWEKWIDLICHDCGNVMLSRDMFIDLHKMIEKNPKMQQGDYFHDYMRDTYVAHVLMMIRKHLKTDSNSISLKALVRDILENSNQIEGFTSPTELQARLSNFENCAKKVEAFADRVIAHRDKREPSYTPTFNDVNDAIDAMDRLCILCATIIKGENMATCKPTVQYGWLNIFRDMGIET
nr:hypothetical protein [Saccharofermentans sp.]